MERTDKNIFIELTIESVEIINNIKLKFDKKGLCLSESIKKQAPSYGESKLFFLL